MTQTVDLDALVLGGGVAGLWTARRLQDAGHRVAVIERDALGAGQSGAAQGIIHGGLKYALGGRLTGAAEALADAPARWRACLNGTGEIDLRRVHMTAEHCWLWSRAGLPDRLVTLLAANTLASRTEPLARAHWPGFLRGLGAAGTVHRLDEPVLDTGSLLRCLAAPLAVLKLADACDHLEADASGFCLQTPWATLRAPRLLLAAGVGNEALLAHLGRKEPTMQRRPLKQVCVQLPYRISDRHGDGQGIHGHCLNARELVTGKTLEPALTITSHETDRGTLLYLGGALAGAGVQRSDAAQLDAARSALDAALPDLDLEGASLRCLSIDRAESAAAAGARPDQPFLHVQDNLFTLWPTKLALTPMLADAVLAAFPATASTGAARPREGLAGTPRPSLAAPFQSRCA